MLSKSLNKVIAWSHFNVIIYKLFELQSAWQIAIFRKLSEIFKIVSLYLR